MSNLPRTNLVRQVFPIGLVKARRILKRNVCGRIDPGKYCIIKILSLRELFLKSIDNPSKYKSDQTNLLVLGIRRIILTRIRIPNFIKIDGTVVLHPILNVLQIEDKFQGNLQIC